MHRHIRGGLGLALLFSAATVYGQDVAWRSSPPPGAITLGRPQPTAAETTAIQRVTLFAPVPTARGQAGDIPPPPPYPGAAPVPGGPPGSPSPRSPTRPRTTAAASTATSTRAASSGRRVAISAAAGTARPTPSAASSSRSRGARAFQSDHCFDYFILAGQQPVLLRGPARLTEVRPIFIWQHTPSSQPRLRRRQQLLRRPAGQRRLHPVSSLVINRLGCTWHRRRTTRSSASTPATASPRSTWAQVHVLPQRDHRHRHGRRPHLRDPRRLASVCQNTGSLSLTPYFAVAQNFGKTELWQLQLHEHDRLHVPRSTTSGPSSFYSSFHLDYNVGNAEQDLAARRAELDALHAQRRCPPLRLRRQQPRQLRLHRRRRPQRADARPRLPLRVSAGIQFGLAGEFNVLGNPAAATSTIPPDGGHDLPVLTASGRRQPAGPAPKLPRRHARRCRCRLDAGPAG